MLPFVLATNITELIDDKSSLLGLHLKQLTGVCYFLLGFVLICDILLSVFILNTRTSPSLYPAANKESSYANRPTISSAF